MTKFSFKKLTYIILISGFVFVGFGLNTNQAQATIIQGAVTGNAAADLVVGTADADYNVSFGTAVTSTAQTITVTLPTGYTITNGSLGTAAVCNSGCAGTGLISVGAGDYGVSSVVGSSTSRTVKITLSPVVDLSVGTTTFRITAGITNATTSGATATSTITTSASGETAQSNIAGVTLTPATASVLVFTVQPSGSVSGIALTGQPEVTARDSFGNTDTNFVETLTVTEASAGSLSANNTSTAVSGVATFSGLIYTATADQQSFTLTASSSVITATSSAVTSDVVATKIIVDTAPTSSVSGVSLGQPIIKYVNAQDTLDTAIGATDTIAVTIDTGTMTSGSSTISASGGIATFTDLLFTGAADHTTSTFTFTDNAGGGKNFSGAPVTALVDPNVVATKSIFTVQPSASVSGVSLTNPTVVARNADDALDTDYTTAVGLTLNTGAGSLSGTTSTASVAGVAAFTTVVYTATADQQSFSLLATSGSLTTTTSSAVTSDVVATKIIVDTAPTSSVSGVSLGQPIIKYVNAQDTLDTAIGATDTIAVTIDTGTMTSGSSTISASGGIATFTDLLFTGAADHTTSTFTFTDNAGGGKNFSGAPVTALVDPNVSSTKIVFTTQPGASISGVSMTAPVITARDNNDLTDTDYVSDVVLTVTTGSGSLNGTTTVAASVGVATFSGVYYSAASDGESFQIHATSGGLTAATSTATSSDVVATKIIVNTQPSGSVSGIALTGQPVIHFTNADNTLDTVANTDVVTVSVLSGGGTASGGTTSTASNGIATFSGLIYTATADQQAFVLRFTDDAAGTNAFNGAPTDASSTTSDVVATKIIVDTAPTSSVSGVSLTQPVIKYVNAQNTLDTMANATDTIALTIDTGTKTGSSTISPVNGIATFTDIVFTGAADHTTSTFTFTDNTGGPNNFNGAPVTSLVNPNVSSTKVVFTTQPGASISGVSMTAPVITARDNDNLTDTDYVSNVVLTVTTGSGSLNGTTTVAASVGVATFSGVYYSAASDGESFQIHATSGGLTAATSTATSSDVVATKIIVFTNPTSSVSGVSMTQPVIRFVNAQNTLDTVANTDVVTASVLSGGGTVSGTTTSTASNGVSTFSALLYNATADQQAFVLRFTDDAAGTNAFNGAPTDASSTTSNVIATKFLVTLATTTATAGSADTLTLTAANAGDITDTGYSATGKTYTFVDASSTAISTHVPANSPATAPTIPSSSTIQAAFSNGAASLSTFTLTKAEVLGTITASDGTLNGTSTSVTVRHATTSAFIVTASTATPTAGTAFNLTILATDSSGNTMNSDNGASPYTGKSIVSASSTSYTLNNNTPLYPFVSDDAGTKTFTNGVTLNTVENGASVTARDLDDASITGTVSGLNVSATADTTAPTLSSIQASSITSSSVAIAWTTNESASSSVEYGTTSSYGSTTASSTLVNGARTVPLTGLTASTLYHFRVSSSDGSANTGTSGDNTFTTSASGVDTTAPTITSIQASSITSSSVSIAWTTDESASSSVEYGTTSSYGSSTASSTLVNGARTVPLTGLTASTLYHFRVNSSDASANTGTSGDNTFTTSASGVDTTAPVITSVQASSITSSSVSIAWTTNESASSSVEYGTDSSYGSSTASSTLVNGARTVQLTGLTASTLYHFRVSSSDGSANTGTSGDNTFTTAASGVDTTAPVITSIQASSITSSSVSIAWTTDESASSSVEYGTTSSYGSTAASSTLVNGARTVPLTGLTASTLYHFRVNSSDASANTGTSGDNTFTTAASGADTTAPTLTGIQASSITSSSVSIAWTTDESASSSVEYGTTSSYGSSTASSTLVNGARTVPLTGLTASTEYHFRVNSSDASANTGTSGDNTFTTSASGVDTTAPTITDIQSTSTATTATITWTTSETSASSTIQYGTSGSYGSSVSTTTSATSHTLGITGLSASTIYHFRVSSADASGNTGTSGDNTLATGASDTTGPTISGQTPLDNATGTAVTVSPVLTFSEALDASTLNNATVQIRSYSDDASVSAIVSYNSASTTVTIDPIASLANSTQYYLYAVGVKDAAGNALTTDYSSTTKASHEFTTAAESVTLAVTSITPSSTFATADSTYANGWSWTFNITVPTSEASSSMKFADWVSGSNTIAMFSSSTSTLRFYSAQSSNATSSDSAIYIGAANTYPTSSLSLTSDLDANTAGRQIQIIVEARVPTGSSAGSYSTSYGVQSQ